MEVFLKKQAFMFYKAHDGEPNQLECVLLMMCESNLALQVWKPRIPPSKSLQWAHNAFLHFHSQLKSVIIPL